MTDVWVIEMMNEDGETVGEIVPDTDGLVAKFVQVNAADAIQFRIARVSQDAAVEIVWDRFDQERAEAEA